MPRLSRLNVGALEDLADQLRYAPARRVRELLTRAESLAGEVEPDRVYPEDWLVQRVTGYRPALDEPALLVGAAILRDLSAFVERVSDHAALAPDDAPGALRVDDLCARWSVSRKTLDRFRRRGLVARRVRDELGHARLAFMPGAVEAFERREADRLRAAAAFDRMDDRTRDRLARLAARARRRYGWSLNETAERLAAHTGRARETLRQLLRRHLSALEPGAPEERRPLTPRQRRFVERADRWGAAPSAIARRLDRTPALVHLVLLQRRAARLRRLGLAPDPAWTPARIANALDDDRARRGLSVTVERSVAEFVALAHAEPPADRQTEHALARAQRALLARAAATIERIDRLRPRAADVDRAETDLRWVAMLRTRLAAGARALALKSIEGRIDRPVEQESPERARALHAEAMQALLQAARSYEALRGGRFAAPANLALNRALARSAPPESHPGRAHRAPYADHAPPLDDWTTHAAPWRPWLDPHPRLLAIVPTLPEPARSALTLRFGLGGAAPRTVLEVCDATGASPADLARALRSARRLARAGATDTPVG